MGVLSHLKLLVASFGLAFGAQGGVALAAPKADPVFQTKAELELIQPGDIMVDGVLEESVYQSGRWNRHFREFRTLHAEPEELGTRFRVFTDGTLLYFAASAQEPAGNVVRKTKLRDGLGGIGADDTIELFIRANADGSEFLQISLNPGGVVTDIQHTQGG